jgi:hypothetical protein
VHLQRRSRWLQRPWQQRHWRPSATGHGCEGVSSSGVALQTRLLSEGACADLGMSVVGITRTDKVGEGACEVTDFRSAVFVPFVPAQQGEYYGHLGSVMTPG